jgi:type VI secretion system secreted protein VgrG
MNADSPNTPSSDPSQAIGGGTGKDVTAWSRPDIVVAAPSGIFIATPATSIMAAGNTVTVVAGQDLNQIAGGNVATAVSGGLVLYTYGKATNPAKPNQETGIAMHAASGNVHVEAQSGAVKLTADRAVEVASTSGMVRIAAPKNILLTAAGAAIDLQSGSITLKGPGKVEFKAGMKVFEGPATATQGLELKKPGDLKGCKLKLQSAAAAGGAKVPVST